MCDVIINSSSSVYCSTIFRKKGLISPDELELPWKPLYELVDRVQANGETCLGMYRSFDCLSDTLNMLVHVVKVYFPVSDYFFQISQWKN